MTAPSPRWSRARPRVLIAGGGVAALETLLALRALDADVDITLVAPEPLFVNRSMSTIQPFAAKRVRGLPLQRVAAELGARWHRGALDRVEHRRRRAVTTDGVEIDYSTIVLALGARPAAGGDCDRVLTYQGGRDASSFRLLLHRLREGSVRRVAFVRPAGAAWPLPLYDLALMTAADCATRGSSHAELSLLTPESEPLGVFGATASAAVRRLLEERGVTLHARGYALLRHDGRLGVVPGGRRLPVDVVVTQPRLCGPRLRGVPCGRDGFIHTDAHGRVGGLPGVFAAGDATSFPVKQGGVAAQQADAVAEMIAAAAGVDIEPRPVRPVLRGLLLTGDGERYLRADIGGGAGDDSAISREPLWAPPTKLYGRHLAPYLARQVDDAADVIHQEPDAIPALSATVRSER